MTHTYTIFAGPKRPALLGQIHDGGRRGGVSLDDYVYYGWFGAVAKAMVGLLHVFYSVVRQLRRRDHHADGARTRLHVPHKSRSGARAWRRCNELKPEMERIKEKYKGDQQKQAKAMQELYRKHNVNPLAGCLPMFIQLPIFIGLYRGLAVDVELRQTPLFGSAIRWCSNLAAPDMLLDWSGFMPKFITSGEGFFGLGPYLNVLPLGDDCAFLAAAENVHARAGERAGRHAAEDHEVHDGRHGPAVLQSAERVVPVLHRLQLVGHCRTKALPAADRCDGRAGNKRGGGARGQSRLKFLWRRRQAPCQERRYGRATRRQGEAAALTATS